MATKKKAPAKKAGSKKSETKAAAAKAAAEKRRAERTARDDKLRDGVVAARENEDSWATIAKKFDITQGRAMYLYMEATIPKKDRINPEKMSDEELQKWVVTYREDEDDPRSWGWLSAASGLGEQRLRTIYKEGSGKDWLGQRIGKGGRYPGDKTPAGKGKKAAKDSNPSKKHIADMSLKELKERMTGKDITVDIGGKGKKVHVNKVTGRSKDGKEFRVQDGDGKSRTFAFAKVKRVSR